MYRKVVLYVAAWSCLLVFGADRLHAQKMYWTNVSGKIQRANMDGTNVEDIVTTDIVTPQGIAIHGRDRKIYWADWGTGSIKRADMDGSNVELVTSESCCFGGIAIDSSGEKIYWTLNVDLGAGVQRANLDGTNVEYVVLLVDTDSLEGITIDPVENKIYWIHDITGWISRSNLDGTGAETPVLDGLQRPFDIAIDHISRKMYWSEEGDQNPGEGKIRSANLDGTNVVDIVSGLNRPSGIAIDVENGKIYWIDSDLTPAERISRADMDGTNRETLITGLQGAWFMALDLQKPVPTVSQWGLITITLLLICGGTLILRKHIAPPPPRILNDVTQFLSLPLYC